MAKVAQIKSFAVTHLTLSLHAAFHQSVKELIVKYTPAALHVEEKFGTYSDNVADELLISNRQTTYGSTAKIEAGAKAQVNSASVILGCVRAHKTSTIAVKSEAARLLDAALDPFRNLRNRKYAEATLDIQAMIALLRAEEPAAWIATLKLEEEVDEAEAQNTAMRGYISQKSAENAARTPQTDVETKEACKETDETYHDIVEICNAYAIVAPSEANSNFITDVNGVIETYKSYIDESSTNTPTVDPGTETPTTPDDSEEGGSEEEGGTTPDDGGTPEGGGNGDEDDDGGSLVG